MIAASIFLTATLGAIAVIDWRTQRIPDRLSLPLLAAGLLWNFHAATQPFASYLLGATLAYAVFAGFGAIYFRLRGHEGLGLGDAKLFAGAGGWLGWQPLPLVLLVASLGGLVFALAVRRIRPTADESARIAFGPWIALAIWLIWMGEWASKG